MATVLLAGDDFDCLFDMKKKLEKRYDLLCVTTRSGESTLKELIRNSEKTCCTLNYRVVFVDLDCKSYDAVRMVS